jgi:hypothetical protein
MKSNQSVPFAGRNFCRKSEITNHFSEILNNAVGRDLNPAEFQAVHELFQWHPNFSAKTRNQPVKRIFVERVPRKHAGGYSTIAVFKFETIDGHIDDFSMRKCIDAIWRSARAA